MSLHVHLRESEDSEVFGYLRTQLGSEFSLTAGEGESSPFNTSILVSGLVEEEQIKACPDLQMLIIPWAGLPKLTREVMLKFPQIDVHNLHHNAIPAAETAVTLMLAAMKKIVPVDRQLRIGDWRPRYEPPSIPVARGSNVLILGYGAIGKEVARICIGLGMQVSAIRRTPSVESVSGVSVYGIDQLHPLLSESNVLIITLPLTEETKGIIGKTELSLLPDGATLVNVARGAVVDEKGLYNALAENRISAGIDVWYRYPKDTESRKCTEPSEYPYGNLDSVVLSPHIAGHADNIEELRAIALAELLNLAANNQEVPNKVDLQRGY